MCPVCRSTKLVKDGIYKYRDVNQTRYKCNSCGKRTIYPLMRMKAKSKRKSKIDINKIQDEN